MFRLIKRLRAIKSFIHRLPLELQRRFGEKKFYSIEELDRAIEGGKFNRAFSAYAYALFCSRAVFDSYFSQIKVNCTYNGLRQFVAKKFFGGVMDFDAMSIIRFAKRVDEGGFYESGLGDSAGTDVSGSHH